MHILHVVLTPRHSGAEILVRDLARIHVEEGHVVGVCALNPPEKAFEGEVEVSKAVGVRWFIPTNPLRKLDRARAVRRTARMLQADVVVAHAAIPSIWTRLGLMASRVPVVTVLHDASEDDFAARSFGLFEKVLRFRNNAVVAVSSKALENYRRRFGQAAKLNLIKNGIDVQRIVEAEKKRDLIRQGYGLEEGDTLLLQVGRIMATKGQLHSLRAALPVLQKNRNLRLWFVGLCQEADYGSQVESLIREHSLEDQVALLGGRDDIPNLLAASDVFLMPSSQEAHSVAMLEGLASAGRCIASRIEVFDFADQYEGVYRVEPSDQGEFTAQIEKCVSEDKRINRDLSPFSAKATASSYMKLFASFRARGAG